MKNSLYTFAVLAISYYYNFCHQTAYAQQQQQQQQLSIDDVLTSLGEETLRFRDEVKRHLTTTSTTSSNQNSCSWLTSCIHKNYDHCYSKFPNEVCTFNSTTSSNNVNSVCSPCGSKIDTSISAVRIADDSKNLDDNTKFNIFHDICTTRILDETYFKDNSISSEDDGHRAMFFGSVDGMFRVYPAAYAQSKSDTEQSTCKPYDPRMRPWYTAATSIERNVILLLDMSVSHIDDAFGNRLQNMKDATIRIITSTTIADKISVVLFNETSISVIGGNNRLFYGTIVNKNLLIDTVTNLTLAFDTNTNTNSIANRTAVYERALEVSNDSRCGATAILLITNDIKNTKDAIQNMDPTFIQYETTTGKSILNFIFLTELSDITLYNFDCTGTRFRTGIYSTIATVDEIGKGLSVYFTVFQKAYELQQTVKVSSTTTAATGSTNVAWVEVYEFYELQQLGTTASASIYDDITGQLLGVVGIDNTLDAIQQLTNTSTIDNIKEKIEFLAGNKDNTNICFNFTALLPCSFHFNENNNITNTVLCSATTPANFTCVNSSLTNETVPTVFNNVTRRGSTINNKDNAKTCCDTNVVANACYVLDETSILWNNNNDTGKTYTERACCTFKNNSNSNDESGVCSANSIVNSSTPMFSPASSTSTPVSKPSFTNPRNTTTTTSTTSATSKAISGGAIFGYVVLGVIVLGATLIGFARHKKFQKQSNQLYNQAIPDAPKRIRPPAVPPMYDD